MSAPAPSLFLHETLFLSQRILGPFQKIRHLVKAAKEFASFLLKSSIEILTLEIEITVGCKKIAAKNLQSKIELVRGDSENIPFEENKFDAVTVAFGVRNFENLKRGLSEILRVLKPGGTIVVLEFSKPSKFPFKQVYNFYFRFILPKIGSIVSNDKAAYTYLPKSVEAFPDGEDFLHILHDVGFKNTQCSSLTFGISSIYIGTK